MPCPYIDNSASFLDGYHCLRIKGKVQDRDITRCYCNSSANYQYCPHNGGDDRTRNKQEPEPEKKPEPTPPRQNPIFDDDTPERRNPVPRPPSRGYNLGFFGWAAVILLAVAVILTVVIVKGDFESCLQLQLTNTGDIKPRQVSLVAVNRSPETPYQCREERFNKKGYCDLKLADGPNDVYMEYDGVSVLMATFQGDGVNKYTAENGFDFQWFQEQSVYVLLVTLEDGQEQPIVTDNLQVTGEGGRTMPVMVMADGRYAVILPGGADTMSLTFTAEGYDPVTATLVLKDRLSGVLLTLAETETGEGR